MNRLDWAVVLVLILILAATAGCASPGKKTLPPVVVTERIEIPVPVRPKPLPGLLTCGWERPAFAFKPGSGNDATLAEKDQPAFRAWIEQKNRCLRALQEWIKP